MSNYVSHIIWEINTRRNSEVIRKKLISNYNVFSGGVIPGGSEQKEMLQDLQRILYKEMARQKEESKEKDSSWIF